jgi:alpha-tubulin suppressor-like RCC1 family protein
MRNINRSIVLSPYDVNRTLSINADDIDITIPLDDSRFQIGSLIRLLPNGYDINIISQTDDKNSVYSWGSYGTTFSDNNKIFDISSSGDIDGKEIVKVSVGYAFTLALDKDGRIYSWGSGQLGYDDTADSRISPVDISESGDINGKKIIDISVGNFHSLALDEDNRVYVWGTGTYGKLGTGNYDSTVEPVDISESGEITSTTNIVSVSAGYNHSLALDDDGNVYTWGNNLRGQLGDGLDEPEAKDRTSPYNISIEQNVRNTPLAGKVIKQICAGGYHSLALDEDGKLYVWGNGIQGQLGDGLKAQSSFPSEVDDNEKVITSIQAGEAHTMVLDKDGDVYAWGSNLRGQTGTNKFSGGEEITPTKVPLISTIKYISAEDFSSLAVDEDNRIYAWGENELLDGSESNKPVRLNNSILNNRNITEIGGTSTYCVVLAKREAQVNKAFGNIQLNGKYKTIEIIKINDREWIVNNV